MSRVVSSFCAALVFFSLPACAGGGLDLADLKAPDQRSVNDTKGVYHRPGERRTTPAPKSGPDVAETSTSTTMPTTTPTVVGGDAPNPTGWAELTDGGQPPVFAPVSPAPGRSSDRPYDAPVVRPAETAGIPPPAHSVSEWTSPPVPPRISSPNQLSPAAGTSDADPYYFDFLGKTPPELVGDGTWITPAVGPSLAALRGQVVFLVFSFQGCEGCKMFMPTMQQWAQTYQPRGVTILYIDNGAIDPLDYAQKAVKEQKVTYAYYHDPKAATVKAYGVRSFPTAYLLDKQGNVIWEGTPTAQEGKIMPLIESALAK